MGMGFGIGSMKRCARWSMELILGLLRRINAMEKKKDELEDATRKLQAKAVKLKAKLRGLEQQLRWQKWVSKFLLRLLRLVC